MAEGQDRAKVYEHRKRVVSFTSLGVSIAALFVFVLTPASIYLRDYSRSVSNNDWGIAAIYFTLFSLVLFLIDLPLTFYSGFILEHKYGLSNLKLTGWIRESAKHQIVSFVFGFLMVELLYAIIRKWPALWWLIGWAAWTVVSIVLGKLWPILIAPLFYKYERLANEPLRLRILRLIEKAGLKIENVYTMNLSKTTKKANAYFCGMGRTRRVVLSDTLLRNFTHDEIAVVVAHEAGHCKKRHIWKGVVLNMFVSFVMFWLGSRGVDYFAPLLGIEGPGDVASFPVIAIFGLLFGLFIMPLGNAFSRALEREADDFALLETRMKAAFISAMRKLALVNLSDPNPHPVIEFLLHSHPSIRKRIARAEAFQ